MRFDDAFTLLIYCRRRGGRRVRRGQGRKEENEIKESSETREENTCSNYNVQSREENSGLLFRIHCRAGRLGKFDRREQRPLLHSVQFRAGIEEEKRGEEEGDETWRPNHGFDSFQDAETRGREDVVKKQKNKD